MATMSGEEFLREIITATLESFCNQANQGDEDLKKLMTDLHGFYTNKNGEISEGRKKALLESSLLSEDESFNAIMRDVVSNQLLIVANGNAGKFRLRKPEGSDNSKSQPRRKVRPGFQPRPF